MGCSELGYKDGNTAQYITCRFGYSRFGILFPLVTQTLFKVVRPGRLGL